MKLLPLTALAACLSAGPTFAGHPHTVPGLSQAIANDSVQAARALRPYAQLPEARLLHRDLFTIYRAAKDLLPTCRHQVIDRRTAAIILTGLERAHARAAASFKRFERAAQRVAFPALAGPQVGFPPANPNVNPHGEVTKCVCEHLDEIKEHIECLRRLVHGGPPVNDFPGLNDFQPNPNPVPPQVIPPVQPVQPQPPVVLPPNTYVPRHRSLTIRKGRFAFSLNLRR